MKVQTLWERIKNGMDEGFDAAITAVHNLTEKAGENIELTRLRREKTRLEIQLTRQLAELGNAVYEKVSQDRDNEVAEKLGVGDLITAVASNEATMVNIDLQLNKIKNISE